MQNKWKRRYKNIIRDCQHNSMQRNWKTCIKWLIFQGIIIYPNILADAECLRQPNTEGKYGESY